MTKRLLLDWIALAVVLWGLALVGIAIHGYLKPNSHTVYDIYAAAARNWWAGADLYVYGRDWYRYSPLFAIAVSPLAALPDGWGNGLWKATNGAVFVAGVWAWLRCVLPTAPTRYVTGATLILMIPGAMDSLYNGQVNLLMTGLSLLGLTAAARGRWWLAAALIAAATLTKAYPFALAMLLAGLYPRAFVPRYLIALAIGLLLPFAFQTPETATAQYRSWFHHLAISGAGANQIRQHALDGLSAALGYPIPADVFVRVAAIAGAAVFGLCLLHARRTADIRARLTWLSLLYSLWVVLFGPATEPCTFAVLAPFAGWLLADAVSRRAGWFTYGWITAGLLVSGPAATDMVGVTARRFVQDEVIQPIGALLLLGYVLARGVRPAGMNPVARQAVHLRRGTRTSSPSIWAMLNKNDATET